MYVHPFIAGLGLVLAALLGAAIAFIWTGTSISRWSKVEHTMLALAYAVSLMLFLAGMLDARTAHWALPVAVMVMGSGTAWANWRVGVKFWLLLGLTAFLGGLSLLITQVWIPYPSPSLFLLVNIPWLALMLWLIGIVVLRIRGGLIHRRTDGGDGAVKH